MKELFDLSSESLGQGAITAAWGSNGAVLAVAGAKRQVVLFTKEGKETDAFPLATPTSNSAAARTRQAVNALIWNHKGAGHCVIACLSWGQTLPQLSAHMVDFT